MSTIKKRLVFDVVNGPSRDELINSLQLADRVRDEERGVPFPVVPLSPLRDLSNVGGGNERYIELRVGSLHKFSFPVYGITFCGKQFHYRVTGKMRLPTIAGNRVFNLKVTYDVHERSGILVVSWRVPRKSALAA